MGQITDQKYKDTKATAKSVHTVQTGLTQAKLKEIDAKYNAEIAEAKRNNNSEAAYVKRRDKFLLDRKIWRNDDQLSLYGCDYEQDNSKWSVYYEQDKGNSPREEQFEHMANFEFKDLETATMVFNAMKASFNIIFSPVTENHILGKPYKVVKI